MKTQPAFDCDPDFRRNPKTSFFCWRCQKDLKPEQSVRWIHLINGGTDILHPESESEYVPDNGDMAMFPVGMDCAKKIGLEWTSEHPELIPPVAS